MNVLEYLQIYFDQLAENKLFIGLLMLLVNIGARFIIEELSDEHRAVVKSDWFRKIVIFSSVFMATRDVVIALTVTIIFVVLINEILSQETSDSESDSSQPAFSPKQELDKQIDQLKLIKDQL